jgi:hypothetical protein
VSGPEIASYQRINYNLRPAKNVERKMMVEALRRLDRVTDLRSYRYVGFGSPYFADFSLIHKQLDLRTMVSIERNVQDAERFEFNKPYNSVEIVYGEASEVLPSLDWVQKSIVWLDYDSPLDPSMLGDIEGVIAKAAPWTVLIVTLDVEPLDEIKARAMELERRLPGLVPPGLTGEILGDWGTARVTHGVVCERIDQAVSARNVGKALALQIDFRSLFHFRYRDGARMLTVGGILLPGDGAEHFDGCSFNELHYVSVTREPYEIVVPKLTYRELDHLDTQLPAILPDAINRKGVPVEDADNYARLYRYFPRFVDAER